MSQHNSAREIAERIVASADSVHYLAESIGKSSLPHAWTGGPSLEVRVRFRPRLQSFDDAELSRRLRALQIVGPLTRDGIARIAQRESLEISHLAPSQPWRPRAFGVWQLIPDRPIGVKLYASSRPAVDLLIAVPARFRVEGELVHPIRLRAEPEQLDRFRLLCDAIHRVVRAAQPIAKIEAMHVQDQSWCDSLRADDRGFMVPRVVCEQLNFALIAGTERGEWVGMSLDA